MKLSNVQKDCINLLLRSEDIGEGWRQCAPKIFSLLADVMPVDLIEQDKDLLRIRLTTEGETVAKWMC